MVAADVGPDHVRRGDHGSDTHAGTSLAPFRIINKAAQVAIAGDVLTIRNGRYLESIVVRKSGASAKTIVFQAGRGTQGGRDTFQPAARW